jgi:uncharacterized protein YndB with AHSA1/START domain
MTGASGRMLRIERSFRASAEEVFDAWTSPEVMRRWLHCGPDWDTPVAEVDLRVGGAVRIVMWKPDGRQSGAHGEYTLIDRPRRLVMTWTFDDVPSNQQLIELTFEEAEGTTTVVLTNRDISSDERREAQDEGWRGCLDELERLLDR